jgi:hypothetical protein
LVGCQTGARLAGSTDHIPELGYERENNRALILISISTVSIDDDHGSVREYKRRRR